MHSTVWWINPLMLLIVGVFLVSRGVWKYTHHDSAKSQQLSQARVPVVQTVLFWVGVFLTFWAARIALGFMKR
jgi:cytochrome c-type biogenesis protein CcmH/NrfF